MIFLDESGKRWKRIKHSTAGMALLSTLPVVALLGGSLAYHPQWGVLQLTNQTSGLVLSASAKGPAGNSKPVAPKPTAKPVARTSKTIVQTVAYKVSSGSTSPAAPATPTPTPVKSAATPTPTPSPGNGNPTKNDFGQSHQPIR